MASQQDGNPIDRMVYTTLIILSICILLWRSFKWGTFFRRNFVLIIFLSYCLLSVTWSDFPLIALKRWFRDMGDYLAVLVILSDPDPVAAVQYALKRLCYVVISLSVLLVKYFPFLSRLYNPWTGASEFIGAATSKNTLGSICLVSGLVFFWDTALRWPDRRERKTKLVILVNAAFFLMSIYLINLSSSATSHVCLVLGCGVILGAQSKWGRRHARLLFFVLPSIFLLYLFLDFGLGMNGQLAKELGRSPDLTGRTVIWSALLKVHTDPLLGTGYESFWLGPRLQQIWQECGYINEAHNGYLDIYLNLGLIGVFLLLFFLVVIYRRAWRAFQRRFELSSLGLAMWVLILFYNMSEAAFKNGLLWMLLILASIEMPRPAMLREKWKLRKFPALPEALPSQYLAIGSRTQNEHRY